MNTRDDVKKFMIAAGHEVNEEFKPEYPWQATLYSDLIKEEYKELMQAMWTFDYVEMADACADLIWVIEGFCHTLGIPMQKVWDEVARSNHSKISDSGKIIKGSNGKVLKPDTYSPPNIERILDSEHTRN
jgi:predicted HAD superfamily Cof-like phosphohydrolase